MLDDDMVWTQYYQRLPQKVLGIPSLNMMGHANFKKAWEALETHYHPNMEIVVVINGSQLYTVDGKQYLLRGGNMFITRPNEIHGNGDMPQNVCEFIWFQLDLSRAENFLGLSGELGERLYQNMINCQKRTLEVDHADLRLLQDAWTAFSKRKEEERLPGYGSLISFLIRYFGSDKGANRRGDEISPDIRRAVDYIEDNLNAYLDIPTLAAVSELSASRFKVKFRVEMGITPLSYITSKKVDRAKEQLIKSSMSVTEIAFSLNFSTSNYFASVFKQYTGYSPSEFRKAHFQGL